MTPNVLLVVLDTARADAFEPYGAPSGSTPVIADLAGRGTAFPLAVSASNWTFPSHASMFTGLLPRALGLRREALRDVNYRATVRELIRSHADRVLPEVLRRRGYDTRAISANVWIGRTTGMDTGFDQFEALLSERPIPRGGLAERLRWWRARADDGAARALDVVRAWSAEPPGRPFFWFVNLMECHSPYFPPKPYNDLGPVERWRAVRDVAEYQDWVAFFRASAGDVTVPSEALRRMRRLYDRSIRQMDDWLGAVLQQLDRHRRLEDTLVIVTSDHGENFGENGLTGHVYSLDQRLLHVPLVVSGPGAPPGAQPVFSLPRLPNAVCRALEIGDHPFDDDVPDAVAIAQDEGFTRRPGADSLARAREAGFSDNAIERYLRPMACATDGRFKLARYGDQEVLFDLEADPLETTDVRAAHPHVAAALAARLDHAHAAGADVVPAQAAPPPVSPDEEAEITRRLEDLGYL